MIVYVVFQYLLISVALILIGYQLLLGILSLLPQPKNQIKKDGFNHSFLFVIHLSNQDQDIIKTLYSLYGMVYPSNLFKLLVIADNCSSNTVGLIRKFGAIVIERTDAGDEGQADYLPWFEQLKQWDDEYDAFVIIEPGVLISGNFLIIMNEYLKDGSLVLQSSSLKVAAAGSWKFKFIRTLWLNYNHINSLGRKKIGLGTKLAGSGMCFKKSVLQEMPFEIARAVDSMNCSLPLLMKGVRIDFVPEAVVWTTARDSFMEFNHRKGIQIQGYLKKVKKYVRYFFNHFISYKTFQDFDTIMDLMTPSVMSQLLGTAGMILINWVLWKFGGISASIYWLWLILFSMVIVYLLIGAMTDRAISLDTDSDSSKKSRIKLTSNLRQ